jgi:PilZ domain
VKPEHPIPRVEFKSSLVATMVAIDGTWQHPCVVHDISAQGAKLGVSDGCPVNPGREFFLLMARTGLVYRRCELVWINGTELGVHFLLGKQAVPVAPRRRVV